MVDQPTSERGEYEITYINNKYVEAGTLRAVNLKKDWFDIGSVDALLEANNFMQKKTHTT
jgi:dTDP-glucose pyrophosphorylase